MSEDNNITPNESLQRIRTFLESPIGSMAAGILMIATIVVGITLVIGGLL